MLFRSFLLRCSFSPALLGLGLAVLAGCQPRIGNACRRDLECFQDGSRFCDLSQPGGYCSVAGCSPISCPKDGSVCVQFASSASPVDGCENPNRPSPYARNYCMQTCGSDSDCRADYECIDLAGNDPWGAEVVQADPLRTTVCVARLASQPVDPDRENGVCQVPPDASAGGADGQGGFGGGR